MKEKSKKIISIAIVLFMVLNYFVPVINRAEENEEINALNAKSGTEVCKITATATPELATVNSEINAIISVRDNLKYCSICGNITENDKCNICNDSERNNKIIFVVEKPKDIVLFEKMGNYNGKYHVLDGLISPLDGVNPEDIGLSCLLDRIQNEKFSEIIFAFKPSIEGETTALYIKKILEGIDIKITRLASGVPIGADMEYVDSLTLERALNDRIVIE